MELAPKMASLNCYGYHIRQSVCIDGTKSKIGTLFAGLKDNKYTAVVI